MKERTRQRRLRVVRYDLGPYAEGLSVAELLLRYPAIADDIRDTAGRRYLAMFALDRASKQYRRWLARRW